MYYYTAIESFDPENGERWLGFTRWLGRSDFKRIVTLDSALCPTVVHPQSADDWQYVAKEEFMLDFFTDHGFVLRRTHGRRPSVVIAVKREPSEEDLENFALPHFELAGFDLVDAEFTRSALFNNRFPNVINISRLSSDSGLLRSREWAFRIRESLKRHYPDQADARCFVWAVWCYTGPMAPGGSKA